MKGLLLALTLAAAPAGAATVDELVARYLEARGGAAAWQAVESFEWTGTYTNFSVVQKFKLQWRRPGSLRFESASLAGPYVHATDGAKVWWIEPMMEANPGVPEAPFDALIRYQAAIEPDLIGWREKGHTLELLGPGDVDGQPTVRLKLTRKEGSVETWHLDPSTGLEVAVDSVNYDMTLGPQALPARAYFSDFKKIGGVLLPHHIEKEWGPRYTVLAIEEVKVNPELPAGVFTMPAK